EGDARIVGVHDLCRAHQEFTVMPLADEGLETFLDLSAEMPAVVHVDSAVHVAEAIRRADDGIDAEVKDGPAMNADAIQVAAEPFPGVGERWFDGSEHDLHCGSGRGLRDFDFGSLSTCWSHFGVSFPVLSASWISLSRAASMAFSPGLPTHLCRI